MLTTKDKLIDLVATVIIWLMMIWEDIKDILTTVVVTFITFFIITTFFFKPIIVNGTSMYPTIKNGSIGFSNVVQRNIGGVERFDIVVVNLDSKEKDLFKRVIGLPGDTITYENDVLYINGEVVEEYFLNEEYVRSQKEKTSTGLFTNDFTVTLGENQYFCMGDNRPVSADSRVYGPFEFIKIKSKGVLIIYPFSSFGIVNK